MKPAIFAALGMAVALSACSPPRSPDEKEPYGSAPVQDVMRAFAAPAGWTVVYESNAVLGVRARHPDGTNDPHEALRRMLRGTGLAFQVDEARRVIFIRPARRAAAVPAPRTCATSCVSAS